MWFRWEVTPPRIATVPPNTSAAKAGLLAGDLVVAVDGAAADGLNGVGVEFLINNHPIGTSASITVQRGSTRKTSSVPIQENEQR